MNHISKNPDDANIGWIIPDEFIERLDNGDIDAIDRYQKALKMKMITGKGYFFFPGKVNRLNPQIYKDRGLTVKASQLCLTGDTIIQIKIENSSEIEDIRLDDFILKYEYGYYTAVFISSRL